MSDVLGHEFRAAIDRHDGTMLTAEDQLTTAAVRARRLRADGMRVSDELIGDITPWTERFRIHRQRLIGLPDRLKAERIAVHRVARRVLWGWSAIWLRACIVGLWIRLHIVAILILAVLLGTGALVAVYWDAIAATFHALLGAGRAGAAGNATVKP